MDALTAIDNLRLALDRVAAIAHTSNAAVTAERGLVRLSPEGAWQAPAATLAALSCTAPHAAQDWDLRCR